MKTTPRYHVYKTKCGKELLIDVVALDTIRKYIDRAPVHALSCYDITLVTRGRGLLSVGGRPYSLKPGDVVFSRPGEVRAWDAGAVPEGYALIFEEEFLLSFFNDSSFIAGLSYFDPERSSAKIGAADAAGQVGDLLRSIRAEISGRRPKDRHILRALLYQMLALLNREYLRCYAGDATGKRALHFSRFAALVDSHFKVRHDTGYYAGMLCITPNYLNEIVQKAAGTNAKSYILNKIILEAKRLLGYTELSVSEIADMLCFDSSSYFIRMFRKHAGCTPLRYRRDAKR